MKNFAAEGKGLKPLRRRILSRLGLGKPPKVKPTVSIADRADFVFQCHRMDARPVRMKIRLDKIRIQGARPLNGAHPFVAGIVSGRDSLQAFYDTFRPADLAEMYGLQKTGALGEDLPPWEIPWSARDIRTPPPGEAGLAADHGVSFYGPATTQKVAVEHRRLTDVRESIQQQGFDPERHGDIEGYGLIAPDDFRFFVRGGKHRVAALASLGWTEIPVAFRAHWPQGVFEVALDDWPLVADGTMSRDVARAIFQSYFNRPV